jgi:hypothetical protein
VFISGLVFLCSFLPVVRITLSLFLRQNAVS